MYGSCLSTEKEKDFMSYEVKVICLVQRSVCCHVLNPFENYFEV